MSKIYITGGLGFIGYHLCKKLIEIKHKVIVYDNGYGYNTANAEFVSQRATDLEKKITIIYGDIKDKHKLDKSIIDTHPDTVIHLASVPVATVCNQSPWLAIETNLMGTFNVLSAIDYSSVKRFIYTSSSFVYGNFSRVPIKEDDPKNPIDLYGNTKYFGEYLTRLLCKNMGIDWIILRPSAVYGPTDCNKRVSQLFVEAAIKGKPIIIEGNGEQRLDFTYVLDTVKGFVKACFEYEVKNKVFNITRGEGRSIKEFVDILRGYFPKLEVKYKKSDIVKELLVFRPNIAIKNNVGISSFGYATNNPDILKLFLLRC